LGKDAAYYILLRSGGKTGRCKGFRLAVSCSPTDEPAD
jgi:hypothetical protein